MVVSVVGGVVSVAAGAVSSACAFVPNKFLKKEVTGEGVSVGGVEVVVSVGGFIFGVVVSVLGVAEELLESEEVVPLASWSGGVLFKFDEEFASLVGTV